MRFRFQNPVMAIWEGEGAFLFRGSWVAEADTVTTLSILLYNVSPRCVNAELMGDKVTGRSGDDGRRGEAATGDPALMTACATEQRL